MPAVLFVGNFSTLFLAHNVRARGRQDWPRLSSISTHVAFRLNVRRIALIPILFHVFDVEVQVKSTRDDANDGESEADHLQVVD